MAFSHPLLKRRDAAQATLDRWADKPLVWSTSDCARMIAYHVRRMGYQPPLPKPGSYRTPEAGMRMLKRVTGFSRMDDVIEKKMGFMPIPYAAAITGDLCAMPPDDHRDWPAMFVVLDNGRVLGFISDENGARCLVATPIPGAVTGAWRVDPQ
jgi:hypothetical protein